LAEHDTGGLFPPSVESAITYQQVPDKWGRYCTGERDIPLVVTVPNAVLVAKIEALEKRVSDLEANR